MEKTEHVGSPEGQLNAAKPRPLATTQTQGPTEGKRPSFEFRGFDFFAKRDFNELKSASDAYFAPKAKRISRALGPASWLRDPTPPASPEPPELPEEAPEGRYPVPPDGKNPSAKRRSLCGLKKSRFWLLVGLLVLLILVVIGVGVGVGVTKQSAASAASADSAASSSSPDVPTSADGSTPSATPTESDSGSSTSTTTPTTTPTASPPAGAAGKLDCPAANGTTYQVPGSDKRFLRICGVDYGKSGGGGGGELAHVPTQSMLDCMTNCAGTYGCLGAGWGYLDGDVGYEHQCWMKSKLDKPRDVALDWSFAILL